MKVFLVLDKWCHGNKRFGISAWESNFLNSFIGLGNGYDKKVFHFDEFRDENPKDRANKELINQIQLYEPDIVFLVLYEMPSNNDKIIDIQSLEIIKNKLEIPIVTIFGDLEHNSQVRILKRIDQYLTLALFTALTAPGVRLNNSKLKYTWVPKDERVFYGDKSITKDIEISYYGSPKPERMKLVSYLLDREINMITGGGERQENIPVKEYANLLRRSKISLGFSRAANCHVTNARAFEVIACNSLLLEQEGMETPKLLKPYEDYIPYISNKDCVDKAKYYLKNESERIEISNNGYNKFRNLYSSKRFWEDIFYFINNNEKPKIKSYLNYNEYWSNNIIDRQIPEFLVREYSNFPKKIVLKYKILTIIMENRILYNFFGFYSYIINIPIRLINILIRIKRKLK